MWGGTDEAKSIATIRAALEHGINLIDTAPVYGFGRSEEIVGKAIAEGHLRSRVLIATKTGIEWSGERVLRNASRARILQEVEDSLRRLRTDRIDVYQVHWPDPLVTTALWSARHPGQLQPVDDVSGWRLDAPKAEIDRILAATISDPVGPEFMAPTARSIAA